MTGWDKSMIEVKEDLKAMREGKVPKSWELDGDPDCLKLVTRLVSGQPTRGEVSDAFEAVFFNNWSRAEPEDIREFIENGLNHVFRLLYRDPNQLDLFDQQGVEGG